MSPLDAAQHMVNAMSKEGICPADDVTSKLVESAGKFVRFHCIGERRSKKNGYAMLYLTPAASGVFGHWSKQIKGKWRGELKDSVALSDWKKIRDIGAQRVKQEQKEQLRQAIINQRIVCALPAANSNHLYLCKKGLPPIGLFQDGARLVAPMTDVFGKIWNYQIILGDGRKLYRPGARRKGVFWSVGLNLSACATSDPPTVYIGEGVATMLAVHCATGGAVVAAMDATSLASCGFNITLRFPTSKVVFCADDDAKTAARIGKNPGIQAAAEAAKAIGGWIAVPTRSL
jgi:putative DNA primase/helicase